jgi:hypothetical protein
MLWLHGRTHEEDELPPTYLCPRCGQTVGSLSAGDYVTIRDHRILHMAIEWGKSLDKATGWVMDDDGGLRPVE